jgi:hypothetical protein
MASARWGGTWLLQAEAIASELACAAAASIRRRPALIISV